MTGEHVEVAPEGAHVEGDVRRGLGAVEHDVRSLLPGEPGDLLDRIHGSERVRNVDHRDDARPIAQQRRETFHVELASVGDRRRQHFRPGALRNHLPGHDVRVVLHPGQEDFVPFPERVAAERRGHQVQALGGPADENDLFGGLRPEEPRHPATRTLVVLRRPLREDVDAAMDVRVGGLVHPVHRVEHRPRLLGARGVVEVGDRPAAHLLGEDGEVGADLFEVVGGGGNHAAKLALSRTRRSPSAARARTASTGTFSTTSPAKPRTRISRESMRPSPRERR